MAQTRIGPFRVEHWMDDHENDAKFNIAETCAASVSIEDLQSMSESKSAPVLSLGKKLTYGPIRGSNALRSNLASLYSAKALSPLSPENFLVTAGGIHANFLAFFALLRKGDHVICHYPTYQQLYSVPASLGADVTLWKTKLERKWQPDLEELKSAIRPNTKMIIINNPQNPTGAVLPKSLLHEIVEIARKHDLILFADEIYRPLFHSIQPFDKEFPPSVLSVGYSRAIATGSVSKAFSLAGIRVGWLTSRDAELVEQCASARHYTTISVSQIDDAIATYALGEDVVHVLLARNIALARTNLAALASFLDSLGSMCTWVRPVAGTTAFVRFLRDGKPVDDVRFCTMLQDATGVLLVPGNECFGEQREFQGYVRFGYVCETDTLLKGLEKLKTFLETQLVNVPVLEWDVV